MTTTYYHYISSPIGDLLLVGDADALFRIGFPSGKGAFQPQTDWVQSEHPFQDAAQQLDAYFQGTLREFNLNLKAEGTKFQQNVWQELRRIPYGTTKSYGEIAGNLGKPKASRAVGAANGKNPLPIIVPCHRVIGSNGTLTGFAGGLNVKEFLLEHEKA